MKFKRILFLEMRQPDEFEIQREIQKKERNNSFFIFKRSQVPLDLLFPATMLKKMGASVRVLDLNLDSFEELKKTAKEFSPDIVLLSTDYICNWQCPLPPDSIAKNMEKIRKATGAVVGVFGPHATTFPKKTLNESGADFIIIGEPENAIIDVCKKGFMRAQGVVFERRKKTITNPNGMPLDLSRLPTPDYSLVDLSRYPEAVIQSSRGCPAHCVFCNKTMYGSGYRQRKLADVIKEIKLLKKKGFKKFYFQDLEFLFNKERMEKFCRAVIKNRLGISWSCTARVNSIRDLATFKLMKRAGCDVINFGLESGAEEVLAKSGKAITLEEVEHSMDLCTKSGINGAYNIIFGLPGENKHTMRATVKFIKKHFGQKNVHIDRGFRVIYFPGSRLFDTAVRQGKIKEDDAYWGMYLQSGTVGTGFKTKKEFDRAFFGIRLNLFAFKIKEKIKRKLLNKK